MVPLHPGSVKRPKSSTVSLVLVRASTHFGRVGSLHSIVSATDCFDDLQHRVPFAACGPGLESTELKRYRRHPCRTNLEL